MTSYLITGTFSLFLKLLLPVIGGVFLGGVVVAFIQGFLASDERTFGFLGRFSGGLIGIYLSLELSSSLLVRYAERLWGGVDLYR